MSSQFMDNNNNSTEKKLYLHPKFLTPLGASSITAINPYNFFPQGIPGYTIQTNAFTESPFFHKNYNPLDNLSLNSDRTETKKIQINPKQQTLPIQGKIQERSILNRSDPISNIPENDRNIYPKRSEPDIFSTDIESKNPYSEANFEEIANTTDAQKLTADDCQNLQQKPIQTVSSEDLTTDDRSKTTSTEAFEQELDSDTPKLSPQNFPVQQRPIQTVLSEDLTTDDRPKTTSIQNLSQNESTSSHSIQQRSIQTKISNRLSTDGEHNDPSSETLQENKPRVTSKLNSASVSNQQKLIQTKTSDHLETRKEHKDPITETRDTVKSNFNAPEAGEQKAIQTASSNDLIIDKSPKTPSSETLRQNEPTQILSTQQRSIQAKTTDRLATEAHLTSHGTYILKQNEAAIDTQTLSSDPTTTQQRSIQAKTTNYLANDDRSKTSSKESLNTNLQSDTSRLKSDPPFTQQKLIQTKTTDRSTTESQTPNTEDLSQNEPTDNPPTQQRSIQIKTDNERKSSITEVLSPNLQSGTAKLSSDPFVQQKPIQTKIGDRQSLNLEVSSQDILKDTPKSSQPSSNLVTNREDKDPNLERENRSNDTLSKQERSIQAKTSDLLPTESEHRDLSLQTSDTVESNLNSLNASEQKPIQTSSSKNLVTKDRSKPLVNKPLSQNQLTETSKLSSIPLANQQKPIQTKAIDKLGTDSKPEDLNIVPDVSQSPSNAIQQGSIQTKVTTNNLASDWERKNPSIPSLKQNLGKNPNLTSISSAPQQRSIQNKTIDDLRTEDKSIAANTETSDTVKSNLNIPNDDEQNIIQTASLEQLPTEENSTIPSTKVLEREKDSDDTSTTLNPQLPIIQQKPTQNISNLSLTTNNNSTTPNTDNSLETNEAIDDIQTLSFNTTPIEQNLIQTKTDDRPTTNNTNANPQITDTVQSNFDTSEIIEQKEIQAPLARELPITDDRLSTPNTEVIKQDEQADTSILRSAPLFPQEQPIQNKTTEENTQHQADLALSETANTSTAQEVSIQTRKYTPPAITQKTIQTNSSHQLETDDEISTPSRDNLKQEQLDDTSVLNPVQFEDNFNDPLSFQGKLIQTNSSDRLKNNDNELSSDLHSGSCQRQGGANIARKKEEIDPLSSQQKSISIISSKELKTDGELTSQSTEYLREIEKNNSNELNPEPFISQREPIQTKIDRNLANESDRRSISEPRSARKNKIETNFSNIDSSLDNFSEPIQTFSKNYVKIINQSNLLDNLSENTQDLSRKFDNNGENNSKNLQNLSKKPDNQLTNKKPSLQQNESDNSSSEEVENVPESWSNIEELLAKSSIPDPPKDPAIDRRSVRSIIVQPLLQSENLTYKTASPELKFPINSSVSNSGRFENENQTIQTEPINDETAEELENSEFSERSTSIDSNKEDDDGDDDDLEVLAREIYWSIRQRIEIERERQGNYYSGTSGW